MHNTSYRMIAGSCRGKSDFRESAPLLAACCALLLLCGSSVVSAQDQQQAAPAAQAQQQAASPAKEMPPMPAAPSAGKALVCIYRGGGFIGSASHDHLYLNGVYWAYLKGSEYAWMEVDPGNVAVTGTTEMYYAGGITMSSYAAIKNGTKKENERIHFDAEAGKTYYMKWTSEPLGTGVKVTMMDAGKGAKELSKLHPTDIVEQPNIVPDSASKPDDASKDAGK